MNCESIVLSPLHQSILNALYETTLEGGYFHGKKWDDPSLTKDDIIEGPPLHPDPELDKVFPFHIGNLKGMAWLQQLTGMSAVAYNLLNHVEDLQSQLNLTNFLHLADMVSVRYMKACVVLYYQNISPHHAWYILSWEKSQAMKKNPECTPETWLEPLSHCLFGKSEINLKDILPPEREEGLRGLPRLDLSRLMYLIPEEFRKALEDYIARGGDRKKEE